MVHAVNRRDNPPHTVRVVYVDKIVEPTIYEGVDCINWTSSVWIIRLMDGRKTLIRFDLVLRIEVLEPTAKGEI